MMNSLDDQSSRLKEQRRRERLLRGHQEIDIRAEILRDYAPEVAAELQINPDLSENTFLLTLMQLAVSYDEPPTVLVEGEEDLASIITPLLWPKMQERDLLTRGVRECFVRLDWPVNEAASQEVTYRVVSPGYILQTEASKVHADRAVMVEELRERTRPDDEGNTITVQTFETWDITDPLNPVFRIEEIDEDRQRRDMTAFYAGSADYPYIDDSGAPIFPYVLYHARLQDRLYDWSRGIEIVAGTLRLAVGWTSWWDAFNDLANPQRVAIDLQLPAGTTRTLQGSRNMETITVSKKTILQFQSTRDSSGRIDTYPPGMAPMEGVEALRSYAERLAVFAGLNPGDLQTSGVQSGISIIVSRDGQRRAQRSAEPSNRTGDQQLLATAARLANSYGGVALPVDERAYQIQYAILGLSQQERKLLIENLSGEQALGLVSRVTMARRLNPDIETDQEALAFLVRQQEQEAELGRILASILPSEE